MAKRNPVKIVLKAKALSVNKCWQGKRYKTQDYKDYEKEINALLMPYKHLQATLEGKVVVDVIFHLKRASTTDFDNLLKPLFDILVKNEIIPDDRFIWDMRVRKLKAEEDKIVIALKQTKEK